MADPRTEAELFDVVDENDVIIGAEERSVVHRRALRHRAVHLFVFNRRGELFLQKRSMLKDTAPGKWSTSCAGHVDAGEDYDAAIVREAGEELGLRLSETPEKIGYVRAVADTGHEFLWLYRIVAEGPFVLPPDEIERGAWWRVDELEAALREQPEIFAVSFRYVWRIVAEKAGSLDSGV